MPYIVQVDREQYQKIIISVAETISNNPETLANFIFEMAKLMAVNTKYATYERIIGTLNCIKLEYKRRIKYTGIVPKKFLFFGMDIFTDKIDILKNKFNSYTKFDRERLGGTVNYIISAVINRLIILYHFDKACIPDVIDNVIDCFYTQEVGPYEDTKVVANGDVYIIPEHRWL